MKNILNDLIILSGEIGSIVQMNMNDEYVGIQVKSKNDDTVYDIYVTKKEEKKDA
jgi:hypothetical protein